MSPGKKKLQSDDEINVVVCNDDGATIAAPIVFVLFESEKRVALKKEYRRQTGPVAARL